MFRGSKEKRRDFGIPALRALGGFGANRRPNLPNLPHQSGDINENDTKTTGRVGRKSSDEPPGGERLSRLSPEFGFPKEAARAEHDAERARDPADTSFHRHAVHRQQVRALNRGTEGERTEKRRARRPGAVQRGTLTAPGRHLGGIATGGLQRKTIYASAPRVMQCNRSHVSHAMILARGLALRAITRNLAKPIGDLRIPPMHDVPTVEGGTERATIPADLCGSIDTPAVKEMVKELLEGGQAAFEFRKQNYGF